MPPLPYSDSYRTLADLLHEDSGNFSYHGPSLSRGTQPKECSGLDYIIIIIISSDIVSLKMCQKTASVASNVSFPSWL